MLDTKGISYTKKCRVTHTLTVDAIVYADDNVIVDHIFYDDVDVFLSDYTNTGTSLRRVCPL